ncbi:Uncharacterised protein [uncultured archaeon]|nr:Uncharacterised protein [uncultured archaeon]
MHRRGIFLSLLAMMLVGQALCEVVLIPASQDVYMNFGTGNERVYNQTTILVCAINVTDINGTRISKYPGDAIIQFDISRLNITDDSVAVLVLKAASIKKQDDTPAMVSLLPIESLWNEQSDIDTFLINILPAWNIIKKNDLTQISSSNDGDRIFAFDVSRTLKEAVVKGNSVSFLLQAIGNSSYEVDFFSRESGQGPCLIIMPYPESIQSTKPLDQAASPGENETGELSMGSKPIQKTIGVMSREQFQQSIDESLKESPNISDSRPDSRLEFKEIA